MWQRPSFSFPIRLCYEKISAKKSWENCPHVLSFQSKQSQSSKKFLDDSKEARTTKLLTAHPRDLTKHFLLPRNEAQLLCRQSLPHDLFKQNRQKTTHNSNFSQNCRGKQHKCSKDNLGHSLTNFETKPAFVAKLLAKPSLKHDTQWTWCKRLSGNGFKREKFEFFWTVI